MTRKTNTNQALAFLANHDGLEQALNTDHPISRDLKRRLFRFGSLSLLQVQLARKLAAEASGQASPSGTRAVDVPAELDGETVTIEGTAVSYKWQQWGRDSYARKVLLVVRTSDGGQWKAFSTAPAGHDLATAEQGPGDRWVIRGTVERKEFGFAVVSRPVLVSVTRAADVAPETARSAPEAQPAPEPEPTPAEPSRPVQPIGYATILDSSPAPAKRRSRKARATAAPKARGPIDVNAWLAARGFVVPS